MTTNTNKRALLGLLCGGLITLGILVGLAGVSYLIDPSAAADDADPFAPAVPFARAAWLTGAGLCALLLGGWLALRLDR